MWFSWRDLAREQLAYGVELWDLLWEANNDDRAVVAGFIKRRRAPLDRRLSR